MIFVENNNLPRMRLAHTRPNLITFFGIELLKYTSLAAMFPFSKFAIKVLYHSILLYVSPTLGVVDAGPGREVDDVVDELVG